MADCGTRRIDEGGTVKSTRDREGSSASLQGGEAGVETGIQDRVRENGSLGVILVDLSLLQRIETTFGLPAYRRANENVEKVIKQVVSEGFREHDMVARTGTCSEHLVVLFFRSRSDHRFYVDKLPALTARLRTALRQQSRDLLHPSLMTSPSIPIGYSVVVYNSALRVDKTVERAFEMARRDALHGEEEFRLAEERGLAHLIIAEQIDTVFEPIVRLGDRRVLGYEALSRGPQGSVWESPKRLFDIAEEAELSFELDSLCRRLALSSVSGFLPRASSLFLNCLPSCLRDPAFSDDALAKTLECCGLTPNRLVIEISEKESAENRAVFRQAVEHFRSKGIRVALDDVGSGYASLSAVMDVRPDIIKIDMSLVHGIDKDTARQELVLALKHLCDRIGASVVAEGIETEAEMTILESIGIELGQGYLFAESQDIREIMAVTGPIDD